VTGTSAPVAPDWLIRAEVGLCPCGCIGKRRRGSFVEKTLHGATTVMRQTMFGEEAATAEGLLQALDPRVKLLTLLGVLVAAGLTHTTPVLLGLYALTLVVAAASRLSLSFFVRRVWLFVPLFTGVVVLPATLNIITSGHIVIPLGHWWFGHAIGVTKEGLQAAALVVTRVAVSISIVVLLTLTTPWAKLLSGLRGLLVPRMFIQVIGMAYRFIFSLLGSVDDMYTARRSRTVAPESDTAAGRAFVSASAGALLGKAHALSDEVHMAMVSRGYTGDARTIDRAVFGAREAAWIAMSALTVAAALGIDRVAGR